MATAPLKATILVQSPSFDDRKRRSTNEQIHVRNRRDAIRPEFDSILWDTDNINYLENLYWISRSVTIRALNASAPPILQTDIIIAKASATDNLVEVNFVNIIFCGTIFIGDASVVFDNCTLSSCRIEQEYQRRVTSEFLSLHIFDSSVLNSTIVLAPVDRREPNYKLNIGEISIQNSTFENSLLNVSCVTANIYIDAVLVYGFSESVLTLNRSFTNASHPVGLHIYTGVTYTNGVTTNETPSGTEEIVTDTMSTVRISNSKFASLFMVGTLTVNT